MGQPSVSGVVRRTMETRGGHGLGDPKNSISTTGRIRGKLRIRVEPGFMEFLDRFVELDLKYGKSAINTLSLVVVNPGPVKSALRISASTTKSLRLTTELGCEYPFRTHQSHALTQPSNVQVGVVVTIRDFRKLELVVIQPESPNNALPPSSITSTEHRKVIFVVMHMRDRVNFT